MVTVALETTERELWAASLYVCSDFAVNDVRNHAWAFSGHPFDGVVKGSTAPRVPVDAKTRTVLRNLAVSHDLRHFGSPDYDYHLVAMTALYRASTESR
jgi:hypothetical protein